MGVWKSVKKGERRKEWGTGTLVCFDDPNKICRMIWRKYMLKKGLKGNLAQCHEFMGLGIPFGKSQKGKGKEENDISMITE